MHDLQAAPSNASVSRKQRLLVGENNLALRDFWRSVFTAEGYEVIGVANGTDLLDAVAVSLHPECGSGEFDLVISEAHIVGTSELQAFSKLGGLARVPPFVLLAAFGEEELHVNARPFDTVAVLEKPLDMANLRDLVNSFLHHPTGERGNMPVETKGEMEIIPESIGK